MNWMYSSAKPFLTGAACMGAACILIMYGWFHFYFINTHDMEVAGLQKKVVDLETYKSDYNVLLQKYNILNFQNLSRKKSTALQPASAAAQSSTEVPLVAGSPPKPKKEREHSIVISQLVIQQ